MKQRHLQKVIFREVKTFFSVSEMLACGHRVESLGQVSADPLIAKHRICLQCARAASTPTAIPKKPPVRAEARNENDRRVAPPNSARA